MTALATLPTLALAEARLLTRAWAAMVFAFVFPPLMMIVLAGVVGNTPDPVYGGASSTQYYIGVPLGALSLIGLPVMLASYRERGVLRRFEAFGVPTLAVMVAQAAVTAALVVVGGALVLAPRRRCTAFRRFRIPGLSWSGSPGERSLWSRSRSPSGWQSPPLVPRRPWAARVHADVAARRRWPTSGSDDFGHAWRDRSHAAVTHDRRHPRAVARHRWRARTPGALGPLVRLRGALAVLVLLRRRDA